MVREVAGMATDRPTMTLVAAFPGSVVVDVKQLWNLLMSHHTGAQFTVWLRQIIELTK